ncbi:MAG: hypothetical protein NTU49_06135, partial [Gammaproteobacteria bacterium]|nr:hypothetical protein [Gammaproteobacteria bacterium]
LEKHTEDNKIYNPYIFLYAAHIYRKIFNSKHDSDMITLLSSQVIGKIQFNSPKAWKEQFAQGIHRLWVNSRSSLIYALHVSRDSHPLKHPIDADSVKELGTTRCIDIYGEVSTDAAMMHEFSSRSTRYEAWGGGGGTVSFHTSDHVGEVEAYINEMQNEFRAIAFRYKSFFDYTTSTIEAGCFGSGKSSYCSMM